MTAAMKLHRRMEFESILLYFYTIQMLVCLPGQESNNFGMGFVKHVKIWQILLNLVHQGRAEDYYALNIHSSNPSVQICFKNHSLKIFLIGIWQYMQIKTCMGYKWHKVFIWRSTKHLNIAWNSCTTHMNHISDFVFQGV